MERLFLHCRIGVGALVALLVLAASACGGSGHSDEELEGAEEGMREIDGLLDDMIVAYSEGDMDSAQGAAERAGLEIYETSEVEGVIADVAPEVNREFDGLIEATIPQAVEDGVPLPELEGHVDRAKELIADALERIEEEEN